MFDAAARRLTDAPMTLLAAPLHRGGVRADAVTFVGLAVGIAAAAAAADGRFGLALGLWLANRLLDGVDGALARLAGPTDRGGFVDLMADFTVYAAVVVGVAVAVPDARLAAAATIATYYLSGGAFLAWSSLVERRGATAATDNRSIRFAGGLAEGAETIVAYVVLLALPDHAATVLWIWAALVFVTFLQRVALVWRTT